MTRVELLLDRKVVESGWRKGKSSRHDRASSQRQYTSGYRSGALEVFNAVGESIAVVAVAESDIEGLRADEVLAVRPLAPAG